MSFYPTKPHADVLSLNAAETERSRQLVNEIQRSISATEQRVMPFAQFMDLALYHPEYGYYTSANEVLGEDGDFTTAPELGELFGRSLAVKLAEIFKSREVPANVYEFGAGSGKLAVQILAELDQLDCRVDQYTIVEISPRLKEIQQFTISKATRINPEVVHWRDSLPAEKIHGVLIANEVLDAMPVELIRIADGQIQQGFVNASAEGFQLQFSTPRDTRILEAFQRLNSSQIDGVYTTEWHGYALEWLQQVVARLRAGSILIVDYGFPAHEYYHPSRSEGTLMCHRRHHSLPDPFAYIGCQDITAHLNYSALAQIAEQAGFEVNGFTTLAGFIVDCGLQNLNLENLSEFESVLYSKQLNTLTSPSEMGEIFKVMELTKLRAPNDLGFRTLDHLHRL